MAFRHFDHRDGLPSSQVSTLMEDRDGFLWLGTGDSVSRLGASGFQVFSGAEGLETREIMALLQDRSGSIWAGGDGLSQIRGGVITNYGAAQGLTVSDHVYSLAEGAGGDLFVGTRLGLFRGGRKFEQVKLPGNWLYSPIFSLAPDGAKGVWMGSRKGLLGHWDGQNLTQVALPKGYEDLSVRGLLLEPDRTLKVLCSKVFLRLSPSGAWQVEPLPGLIGEPEMYGFREDGQGGVVISLGVEGVYLRSPSGQGQHLTYRDGLPRQLVTEAFRDRRGLLWIGLDGGGLLALPTPQLKVLAYNPETGLDLGLGTVLHFLELPGGRMLMATFGGLVLWEEGKGVLQRWDSRNGLPSNEVWTLASDGAGGAWLGTSKGVARWSGGRIQPGPKELKDAVVSQFIVGEGRIWTATSLGLAELSPKGAMLRLSPAPQEVGSPDVSQMLPRPWGLLVGTDLGLYTFRDGQYKRAYADSPAAKLEVTSLDEDASGQLWVGTLHGLFGLVGSGGNRSWKAMTGTLQNGISWVRTLPSGTLAVGHSKGVTILPPGGEPTLLTRNLGLLSDETNQDGALLDHRGRLWVGMLGGANILEDPSRVSRIPLPGPRLLEAGPGSAIWLPDSLTLAPNPSNLSLRFDSPLPCSPQRPQYQVKIEGLDSEWKPVGGVSTSVQIAHLGPGAYLFRARASLDGVNWSESVPCPIFVRRAWHQTYLARGAFLLLLGGLSVLLVQFRVKNLERRALMLEGRIQERTQELALRNQSLERVHHQLKQNMEGRLHFINSVTHDLRSPVTSIMLGVDRLKAKADPALDPVLNLLERESRRLEALLKGMLDQGRAESLEASLAMRLCRPHEILQGLTDTFQIKAQAKDLSPRLDLDAGSSEVWVVADVTAMQQVLFNLIENALKFTAPPGAVGIRSRVLADAWKLEVWDEGRGIEASKLGSIFKPYTQARPSDGTTGWGLGLSICKSIAEAHSGHLEVESEEGRGSLFRVTIPLVQSAG